MLNRVLGRRAIAQRLFNSSAVVQSSSQSQSPSPSQASTSAPAAATSYTAKHTKTKGSPIPEATASKSPGLQTLKARLKLEDIPYSTVARSLISDTANLQYTNNAGMAKFGRTLLSFYVYEHTLKKYPRLPTNVLKHVVDMYTSLPALAQVGELWGIQQETRSSFERYLANVGDDSCLGRLTFTNAKVEVEKGVLQVDNHTSVAVDQRQAMGVFVRALVTAVYAHRGLDGAKDFVESYIIQPRSVDLLSLMTFSRPTRELTLLCEREGMEAPVSRLMAETGRFSQAPVFVVGVFSGNMKLGEGQGSSLKEARTRAAVNALQGWYLYSPIGNENYVDKGEIVI